MTERTIIKALAIILSLPLFFSCSKDDEKEESNPITEEQDFTVEESEATRLSVKNLIESSNGISLTDFITEAKKLQNIKEATVEDSLVYLTTTAGGFICVDLYGSSQRKQDNGGYSVDTCGTYIQNYIEEIEKQYSDSISEGVEYDPIESDSIEVNYGDEEDVIVTRATLHHRRILNKRTIAVWSPWTDPDPTDNVDEDFRGYDEKWISLIAQKCNIGCYLFSDFSPNSFRTFGNYDIVYLGSHGAKDGSILLPIDYESLYCSKYKYTKDGKTYVDESAMSKDGISYLYSTEYFGLVKKDRVALKLDKRFLNSHLPNLSNTIICTSMCYAGRSNSQLLQSARNKGCPEFYGGDRPVYGNGPMSFFFYFLPMFTEGASAKHAFEIGKRDMYKTGQNYNYLRYGNTNVTYFNPYITGVREVKDKSAILGVKFQFSLDIPGSVNSETANQFGIYLENLGQYIPLSNSNVVNQATTTLYNSVCAYYANVKIDGLTPNTNYRYRSYVIVGNKVHFSGTVEKFKTKALLSLCPDNNHPHSIDLGLPSGTKWACCNVDATAPEEYGGYYQWGVTSEGYIRNAVNVDSYGVSICGTNHDVAHVKWGGNWRLPTYDEIKELSECEYESTQINGVDGCKVTGKNGNSIFLPYAGCFFYDDSYKSQIGIHARYWTGERDSSDSDGWSLVHVLDVLNLEYYDSDSGFKTIELGSSIVRNRHSVRPVNK